MIRMLPKKYFQPNVYSMSTRPFEERVPGEEAFMILGAARFASCKSEIKKCVTLTPYWLFLRRPIRPLAEN